MAYMGSLCQALSRTSRKLNKQSENNTPHQLLPNFGPKFQRFHNMKLQNCYGNVPYSLPDRRSVLLARHTILPDEGLLKRAVKNVDLRRPCTAQFQIWESALWIFRNLARNPGRETPEVERKVRKGLLKGKTPGYLRTNSLVQLFDENNTPHQC